jgi:hypothetical protein
MGKFKTRRFIAWTERLAGRSWEDVAPRLEDFLRGLTDAWMGGIPPGFNDIVPPTIQAGVAGSSGSQSDGWMSASAQVPIETGVPAGLGNANSEGTGTALMRASALIKRDVRVRLDGTDIATRNALDFRSSADHDISVVDNPAADNVEISITARSTAPGLFPSGDTGSGSLTDTTEGSGIFASEPLIFYAYAGRAIGQGGQ